MSDVQKLWCSVHISYLNMNKTRCLLSAKIFLSLWSCSPTTNESHTETITIDLSQSQEGQFSELFEGLEYILLDSDDSNPLVHPYNFSFEDGQIIVNDLRRDVLFFFNQKGQILKTINPSGKGPGEYFQMDGYQITDQHIYIQDTYLYKTLQFDRDGNLLSEIKNNFNNTEFYHNNTYSLYFLSYSPDFDGHHFIKKNHHTGETKSYLPIAKDLIGLGKSRAINGYVPIKDDGLAFALPSSTNVAFFTESTGDLIKAIHFDFGKHQLEDQKRWMDRHELNTYLDENNLVENISFFFQLEKSYIMRVAQGGSNRHVLIMDEDLNIIKQWKNLKNDIDGINLSFPWTSTSEDMIFLKQSSGIYNDYLATYAGKKVVIEKHSIHDFFDRHKERLKEDKWVIVKAKYKKMF